MIGSKTLSTIQREIEEAFAPAGGDPIERLEQQVASAKRRGERTEVIEGLKRFLESRSQLKKTKSRSKAKK